MTDVTHFVARIAIVNRPYASGATPLDLDEINGLIPLHITTQGQLNEWEAADKLADS